MDTWMGEIPPCVFCQTSVSPSLWWKHQIINPNRLSNRQIINPKKISGLGMTGYDGYIIPLETLVKRFRSRWARSSGQLKVYAVALYLDHPRASNGGPGGTRRFYAVLYCIPFASSWKTCLSIHHSIWTIHLSRSLSLSIYPSIDPSVYPSICPSIVLSIHHSISLSLSLSVSLSINLSSYVSLSTYLFISISWSLSPFFSLSYLCISIFLSVHGRRSPANFGVTRRQRWNDF